MLGATSRATRQPPGPPRADHGAVLPHSKKSRASRKVWITSEIALLKKLLLGKDRPGRRSGASQSLARILNRSPSEISKKKRQLLLEMKRYGKVRRRDAIS